MADENQNVVALAELASALKIAGAITIPNEACAQLIIEKLQRGTAVRFLCITVSARRTMWSVGQEHSKTLYGDHPRGKVSISQLAVAINATIDRSFAGR